MRLHRRVVAGTVIVAALTIAPAAFAGAPNYRCWFTGRPLRVAYDDWRNVLIITRPGRPLLRLHPAESVGAGGERRLRVTVDGETWHISTGRLDFPSPWRATLSRRQRRTVFGTCVWVDPRLLLRAIPAGTLHTRPSPTAVTLTLVPLGTPGWQCQRYDAPGWSYVTVYLGGRRYSGWIHAPPLPADPRQSAMGTAC